jgi:hypothetical protein
VVGVPRDKKMKYPCLLFPPNDPLQKRKTTPFHTLSEKPLSVFALLKICTKKLISKGNNAKSNSTQCQKTPLYMSLHSYLKKIMLWKILPSKTISTG